MLAKLSLMAVVFILASCSDTPDMDCTFDQLPGKYQVTGEELDDVRRFKRTLVLVTRDGRTFMFRRDQLDACQSAVEDSQK